MVRKKQDLSPLDLVEAGRQALAQGSWADARARFEDALASGESPEALEGLSWAAWWLNDAATLFRSRDRAYRLYRSNNDHLSAARMAIWLASDHLDFRGEEAIANGWRQRARRLLDGLDPSPEHGWLALHDGDLALLSQNDTATAKRKALEAVELGRLLDIQDLEILGLAMEGIALVTEGDVSRGMDRLDEATTAALAGELHEVYSVTWALCYLIYACERVRDYDRAGQWCRKMRDLAEAHEIRFALGICRAHYGGVLLWRGAWDEAEAELSEATQDFEVSRPPMAAEATVRLAELRRRQGRFGEAAELFAQVEWHPLAVLGLAELALDMGEPATAEDRAQGVLRDVPADNKTQRIAALDVMTRAAAAAGEHDRAAEMLDVLRALSSGIDSQAVRAAIKVAEGAVAAAAGDDEESRHFFDEAATIFGRTAAPFEEARARLELAAALSRLGRHAVAEHEAKAALASFERIGANVEAERAAAFIRQLQGASGRPDSAGSRLTAREIDVLRLVAQGLSDKEVAVALTLSEHTVHRHVANILSKLDLPSRAAAVAFATREALI